MRFDYSGKEWEEGDFIGCASSCLAHPICRSSFRFLFEFLYLFPPFEHQGKNILFNQKLQQKPIKLATRDWPKLCVCVQTINTCQPNIAKVNIVLCLCGIYIANLIVSPLYIFHSTDFK